MRVGSQRVSQQADRTDGALPSGQFRSLAYSSELDLVGLALPLFVHVRLELFACALLLIHVLRGVGSLDKTRNEVWIHRRGT